MTYKILALGGGGSKGILHIGALKVLEERGKLIEIFSDGIYGCSVGSMYATCVAFGLNSEQLENMSAKFSSFNDTFLGNLTLNGLSNSLNKKGFFEMDLFEEFIVKTFFEESGINLREKKISDALIPLKICATNITKKKLTVFKDNFPVLKALRASCCIPVIFCPQEINNSLYIDGGYLTNIVMDFVPQIDKEKTLSISIIHDDPKISPKNIKNLSHLEFLYGLYKITCIYERFKNPHKNNIDLQYNLSSGISDVSEKERKEMIERGSELTRRFLSKTSF
jgi:NTE family protein